MSSTGDRAILIAETERLLLRCFHAVDVDVLKPVLSDAEVMRFGPGVQTAEGRRVWLQRCLESYNRWGFGRWAVVEKSRREVIGYCGLTWFPHIDGRHEIEIGYRLVRAFWGRGYAAEAAAAVRDHAFHQLHLTRLIALIDPRNASSIRVAEKIGMRYEKDLMLKGYTHPDRLYAIARTNET